MENMLEFRVLHGKFLKDALSVISKIADKALVLINNEGLSILVRSQENQDGQLVAILRLRKIGCSHYQFRFDAPYAEVGISLARFRDILNNATEQDSVSVSFNESRSNAVKVDFINSVTSEHRIFPLQVLPYNTQEFPFNAPLMNADETAFRVTASIPSERFCDILTQLRYERGPDNAFIDTHAPVDIMIISTIELVFETSRGRIPLKRENEEFTLEGATRGDCFHLTFPVVELDALLEAARLSDRVFILANRSKVMPLLNCPYGEDLGVLLFVGNYCFSLK